ncbi:hypothetical protein AB0L57_32130 [Nocardia sp. NPDC052254]|uniref:hypothetical protein n=1 Tax=Nocardia sp. NPDC052254 TaxID=3155681 RepID=UPI00341B3AC4
MPAKQVARLSGLSHTVLSNLSRAEHITAHTEAAVMGVAVPEVAADIVEDTSLVPATGSIRRIQALVAFGYPQSQLAQELGIEPTNLRALTGRNPGSHNTGEFVQARRHRAVAELFDRLQMVPGPSKRAQNLGRRMGWALPFEWDEDRIDVPAAQPESARWKPMSQTLERRERVREMTGRGLSAREIADRLHTTARTVTRDRAVATAAASLQITPYTHRRPISARPEIDWGLDR